MSLILLRDLPGIGTLEWAVEQNGWSDDLEDRAHDLAEHHFGISEYDIDDDLEDETHFPVMSYFWDEAKAYWAKHGWDVSDENGLRLKCMDFLSRPLVCVVERLHPDAKFGDGHEQWAARLEEDAKRFKSRR